MPSLGGSSSPSLRKMEMGGSRFGPKPTFSMSNIAGDPFWLGSIGIAMAGWLVAFVGSIVAVTGGNYPDYSWWSLVYMIFCIVGVIYIVGSDTTPHYHVAASSALSAGLVFTTSSVNSLVYYGNGGKQAAAAGFILLSIVAIVWMIYFGSQSRSVSRAAADAYAMNKDQSASFGARRSMRQSYRPETQHSQPQQMYNSSALAGFETSSPITGYPGGVASNNISARSTTAFNSAPSQPSQPIQSNITPSAATPAATATPGGAVAPLENTAAQPTEYPYRAKAIYSYEANPDDANEISFAKHEILEVSDVSGRWWQAKKENGDTGIAPSNYLILL